MYKINRKVGAVIKRYKLNKIGIYLVILCLLNSFLFSCSQIETSEKESMENESSKVIQSTESSEEKNDEESSIEVNSSEEETIPPEEQLKTALENTEKAEMMQYDFVSKLAFSDTATKLNSSFVRNIDDYSSFCSLSTLDTTFFEINNYFINDIAYIDDKILGKSKFQCMKEDFVNYLNNSLYYYFPTIDSSAYTYFEESKYTFNLTEQVENERFFLALLEALSIQTTTFESGSFVLRIENNLIADIEGEVLAKTVLDETEHPLSINFSIKYTYSSTPITPNEEEYADYIEYKNFLISKSVYNLVLTDGYSLESNSRIFFNDTDKNIITDVSTIFSTSFTSATPSMSYISTLTNEKSFICEKYIHDCQFYTRSYVLENESPPYTITEADSNYSSLSSLEIWNNSPFSVLNAADFTITETESFYIVEYKYKNEKAIDLLKSYFDFTNNQFQDLFPMPTFDTENTEYRVSDANGTVTIRKNDFILIEQDVDITISFSKESSIRLVSTTEVISMGEDVSVVTPTEK